VATLSHSAAHATVFTFTKTMGDFCPAFVSTLERLGGVPAAGVLDNDSSMVATGSGKKAVLPDEVAALFSNVRLKPISWRRSPESKGQVDRHRGVSRDELSGAEGFESIEDLQEQHGAWAQAKAPPQTLKRR